jgi:hypothetical protein
MNEDEPYRTILASCSAGPRLISHRIASWEWESRGNRNAARAEVDRDGLTAKGSRRGVSQAFGVALALRRQFKNAKRA